MHELYEAPNTIRKMMGPASQLLGSMTPDQRALCELSMDDPARLDFDFVPKHDRAGIPLWQLDRHQRVLVHLLLSASLSMRAYTQVLEVMAMENVLRELQAPRMGLIAGDLRNSENYFVTIYGRPSHEDTWGWRFLGHHVSLSYTIVGQRWLSVTPTNLGAQPAEMGVLGPLRVEDDLGFAILEGLEGSQRESVVIHDRAPADFATRQVPRIGKIEYPDYIDLGIPDYQLSDEDREALKFERERPRGLPGSEMPDNVASTLLELVDWFVRRTPDEVADRHMDRIRADGLDKLWFCWAGGQERGTSHYYRVQGPNLLIEFDDAIDNGNHIHSVWRDLEADLGYRLLLDHAEQLRAGGKHLHTRFTSSVPEDQSVPTQPEAQRAEGELHLARQA